MSLPVPANNTCDIYRNGNVPPADPDVPGVGVYIKSDWVGGQEPGDRRVNSLTWTHIMLVEFVVNIRDCYAGGEAANSLGDTVFVPDRNGIALNVIFIERIGRGTAQEHKRVYLDRQLVQWPAANLV